LISEMDVFDSNNRIFSHYLNIIFEQKKFAWFCCSMEFHEKKHFFSP